MTDRQDLADQSSPDDTACAQTWPTVPGSEPRGRGAMENLVLTVLMTTVEIGGLNLVKR